MRGGLIAMLLLVLLAPRARAHPIVGAALPSFALEDLDGHARSFPGAQRAIVLVFEDDRSSKQKQAAHAVVGRYSDNPANRSIFELVAVADLERYRWWPASKYALASIKKTSSKESTTVWIDWHGALRKAAGLRSGESAFFVVGADGAIRWFAQGQLDAAQCKALDDAIAALGATPAPGRELR